jgi:hypothetical protein
MYADLLSRALGKERATDRSNDLLMADLVQSRARLQAAEDTATTPADEVLARELSYDGALIALCRSLDVPATTPTRFASPIQERARLERELADRGIVVDSALRA